MKRTLAILLVLAMLVCMVPAFAVSAAEEDTSCTVTEVKNETVTILPNKSSGWYYTMKDNGTQNPDGSGVENWNTTIPEGWAVTTEGQVFDNGYRDKTFDVANNVWNNNRDLWIVRKVTITAEQYNQYADWSIASTLKHTDQGWFYINGEQVAHNPGGNTWQDELANYVFNKKVSDCFKADGDAYSAWFAAYAQTNGAGNARHLDMSVEFKQVTLDEYTQVTIANAAQWNDYVDKNISGSSASPVNVKVTGNLDFTGMTVKTMNKLSYTTIDFGSEEGYTVSGITYEGSFPAGQTAVFAVEAGNSTFKNLNLKDSTMTLAGQGWFGILVGWASGNVTIDNVTIDGVTITHNGNDPDLTLFCGAATLVGVSNGNLSANDVTIKNTTINAENTSASIVTSRCGGDGTTRDFKNITVEGLTVNALGFGNDVVSQLCYKAPTSVTTYTNIDLSGVTVPKQTLVASKNGYSAYFQTRDGATEGTKDFRIIVVATDAYVNQLIDLGVLINFDVTFRSTAGNKDVSTTLTANEVYSSIKAMNGDTEVTYSAAADTYIFGWVISGVPADYANESGTAVPVLNMKIVSDKYQELELTYTKDSYYNSNNGNANLTGGWSVFYATQYLYPTDLPVGTIITVDSNWQYRAERWNDNNVRPEGMERPDNVTTNITVIDENWWGECTKCGINVSKISQSGITDDEMATIRLHIYVPVAD